MQISVKTPPELTLRVMEKCALLNREYPSGFAFSSAWQCIIGMNHPHSSFHPLHLVSDYYYKVGREMELQPPSKRKPEPDNIMAQLADQDRAKRAAEAAERLEEFRAQWKTQTPPKHLHLKISDGGIDLVNLIRHKADWLRLKPNAFVVACLRDCLDAMDDPQKALRPPPIVVDYWTVSKAHLGPKAKDVIEKMVWGSQERMIRDRSGPILDTLIRFALKEEWETPLKQILSDAGVFPEEGEMGKEEE